MNECMQCVCDHTRTGRARARRRRHPLRALCHSKATSVQDVRVAVPLLRHTTRKRRSRIQHIRPFVLRCPPSLPPPGSDDVHSLPRAREKERERFRCLAFRWMVARSKQRSTTMGTKKTSIPGSGNLDTTGTERPPWDVRIVSLSRSSPSLLSSPQRNNGPELLLFFLCHRSRYHPETSVDVFPRVHSR